MNRDDKYYLDILLTFIEYSLVIIGSFYLWRFLFNLLLSAF